MADIDHCHHDPVAFFCTLDLKTLKEAGKGGRKVVKLYVGEEHSVEEDEQV